MPKYQFYTFPYNQRDQFTYLNCESNSFIGDEAQLLEQNFAPDGVAIVARDPQHATQLYQNRTSSVMVDYQRSFVSYVIITAVTSLIRRIKSR